MANSSSAWGYLKIISTNKETILKTIYLFDKYIKQYGYHTTLSDIDIYEEEELKSFDDFKNSRGEELYKNINPMEEIDENGDNFVIKDELQESMGVDVLPEMYSFRSNFYGDGRWTFMYNLESFNRWLENELNPDTESEYYERYKEDFDARMPQLKEDFKLYQDLKNTHTYVYYDFVDEEAGNMVLYTAKVLHHINGDFIYSTECDLDYTRNNLVEYADYDPNDNFDLTKKSLEDFFDFYFADTTEYSDLKFLKETGRLEYFKKVLSRDVRKLESYGIWNYDLMCNLIEETFRVFRKDYKFLPKEMRTKINVIDYNVDKETIRMTVEEIKDYFKDNYRYNTNDYDGTLAEGYGVDVFKGTLNIKEDKFLDFIIKELRIGKDKDNRYTLESKFDRLVLTSKNGTKDLTNIIQNKNIKHNRTRLASVIRYSVDYRPKSQRWHLSQIEDLLDLINLTLLTEHKVSII